MGVEKDLFEDALLEDEVLRQDFELHKEVFFAVGNPRVDHLEDEIRKAGNRYFKEGKTEKGRLNSFLLIGLAAGLSLLIVIGWFIFAKPAIDYAEAFVPFEAPTLYRGEEVLAVSEEMLLGLSFYEQARYTDAIVYLDIVAAGESKERWMARLLLGVSYFALEEYSLAEFHLERLVRNDSHLLEGPTLWYLGLVKGVMGNEEEALVVFDQLKNLEAGEWSKKAKGLSSPKSRSSI